MTTADTIDTNTIPQDDWTADQLSEYVRALGVRTLADRWKIGRAVNFAFAQLETAEQKKFIKENLPGWSESSVYRCRKLAKRFKNEKDVAKLDEKKTENRKKGAAKRKEAKTANRAKHEETVQAYSEAMQLLDKIETDAPALSTEVAKLRELLGGFVPDAPKLLAA